MTLDADEDFCENSLCLGLLRWSGDENKVAEVELLPDEISIRKNRFGLLAFCIVTGQGGINSIVFLSTGRTFGAQLWPPMTL